MGLPAGRGAGGLVWAGWSVTFIRPERVFIWHSKERAPKTDGIGRLEKSRGSLDR